MLRKNWVILSSALLSVVAFIVFDRLGTPAGVVTMGDGADATQWIALASAIISLITAVVGVVLKVLERRER